LSNSENKFAEMKREINDIKNDITRIKEKLFAKMGMMSY